MFVSVIIPCYNAESTIEMSIDSCLNQQCYIKEIIVIDDFSTDDTWEILNKLCLKSELIKIFHNVEKGGNNARNLGLNKATGEFIQWLDADDILLDNKLETQVKVLCATENIDVVFSDWSMKTITESNEFIEIKRNRQYQNYFKELLIDNWSPLHVYLMKYEVAKDLQKVKLWNTQTKILQDREYFTICAALGYTFQYVEGNFAQYNRYNFLNSVSRDNLELKNETIYELMKNVSEILCANKQSKEIKELIYINMLSSCTGNKRLKEHFFCTDFLFVVHKLKICRKLPELILYNLLHFIKKNNYLFSEV